MRIDHLAYSRPPFSLRSNQLASWVCKTRLAFVRFLSCYHISLFFCCIVSTNPFVFSLPYAMQHCVRRHSDRPARGASRMSPLQLIWWNPNARAPVYSMPTAGCSPISSTCARLPALQQGLGQPDLIRLASSLTSHITYVGRSAVSTSAEFMRLVGSGKGV